MLSQTYKPTDIFHLAPQKQSERHVVDHNRSTVFDEQPNPVLAKKVDRMASDLFFLQGYQPSVGISRRSSPKEVREEHADERFTENHYSPQDFRQPTLTPREDLNQSLYGQDSMTSRQELTRRDSATSLFGPEHQPLPRGSRRHFDHRTSSSIFESEGASVNSFTPRQSIASLELGEDRQWVPSVKQSQNTSTSFSNLFGDYQPIDHQNRRKEVKRVQKPVLSREERLRVFGLSSQDMHREREFKKRGVTDSQIWF
jgi:hypothetical protein